tara:strand:+ start:1184 stop:2107 length:924 start_codon:yes stop_codon:yes gene_type:complete
MNQIIKEKKDFLSNGDFTKKEIVNLIELALKLKNKQTSLNIGNKVLGLVFDKASTRTRVSFQVAMTRLGGITIDLNPGTTQIGRGEPIKDTARVLSKYCDVLAIRTFNHSDLKEYAKWASIPVINALTDLEHPCQALADFLTMKEEFGDFNNINLTFIGDGNNVANSLIICGAILGAKINIVCPKGYEPPHEILKYARNLCENNSEILVTDDLVEGIRGSNVLYTDVWSSMGQENNKQSKEERFKGYTLDKRLIDKAEKSAIVMHCLPAYRGKEIADDVFESIKSRIFNQAENRLHAQQALLYNLIQ